MLIKETYNRVALEDQNSNFHGLNVWAGAVISWFGKISAPTQRRSPFMVSGRAVRHWNSHLPAFDGINEFVLTHFLLHSLFDYVLPSLIGFVFCPFFSVVLCFLCQCSKHSVTHGLKILNAQYISWSTIRRSCRECKMCLTLPLQIQAIRWKRDF